MDMITSRADENALKAKFIEFLLRNGRISRRALLASEYQIAGATRRADLAILNGKSFIGVEVKSEFDTLSRLSGQTTSYLEVFDEVWVLVASKHLDAAERLLPETVTLFSIDREGVVIERRGAAQNSPNFDGEARKSAIVSALPKANLLRLAKLPDGRHSRHLLMEAAKALTVEALRLALLAEFRRRYEATSKSFWAIVPRRKTICPTDLLVLSRFASRKQSDNFREEQANLWGRWLSQRQDALAA